MAASTALRSTLVIASRTARSLAIGLLGLAAIGAPAQLLERPTIGLKAGFLFADTFDAAGRHSDIQTYWAVGADIGVQVQPVLGGKPRADVDLAYGPGDSSLFRVGLSQVWSGPAIQMRPYAGFGVGFLFEDKRNEGDRTVLSAKLFGGLEFGKNTFVEAALFQSSKVDAVTFGIGVRF